MKNKKLMIWGVSVLLIIFLIVFLINVSKLQKNVKNSSSQEIVDYILNINSYEAKVEIEINSNKNSNKYVLKQQYIKDKASTQEVLEPSNIQGVKIIRNGNNVKVENTTLNLSTIIENYNYLSDNSLDLNTFVEDYKKSSESTFKEVENQIVMKTVSNNDNKYTKYKILYIDRKSGNPIKMEIQDINKNTTVYILYKEVKINSLEEKNILAFSLYNVKEV